MNRDCAEGLRLRLHFEHALKEWGWFDAYERALQLMPVGLSCVREFQTEARHAHAELISRNLLGCSLIEPLYLSSDFVINRTSYQPETMGTSPIFQPMRPLSALRIDSKANTMDQPIACADSVEIRRLLLHRLEVLEAALLMLATLCGTAATTPVNPGDSSEAKAIG